MVAVALVSPDPLPHLSVREAGVGLLLPVAEQLLLNCKEFLLTLVPHKKKSSLNSPSYAMSFQETLSQVNQLLIKYLVGTSGR